jgi:hypothetical protein
MSHATSAPAGGVPPGGRHTAIAASTGHRVIYHAPICPTCESANITTDEIETTDGLTEEAFVCLACGETWPLACVTDWGGRP